VSHIGLEFSDHDVRTFLLLQRLGSG
jgi:hypothetical protein